MEEYAAYIFCPQGTPKMQENVVTKSSGAKMTKPKVPLECPICGKVLVFVSRHLRVTHKILNEKERAILNNMATGRTVVPPGPCPMLMCLPYILHIEKHIRTHLDMGVAWQDGAIRALKRSTALRLLADLRASNPSPPMVSRLDLDEAGNPEEGVSGLCQLPACIHARQRVRQLEGDLADLKQTNDELTRRLREDRPRRRQPPKKLPTSSSSEQEEEQEEEDEEQQPPQARLQLKRVLSSPPETKKKKEEEEEAVVPQPPKKKKREEEEGERQRARQLDGGTEQAVLRDVTVLLTEEQGLPTEKDRVWSLH
ncbi:cyclin-dependent kinase 11A [Solea solea]|uniref:cyclin-dependent kinase 11A n=1 Tax=Solea solea TaxID=90069 RepID=UPI00272B53E5|nr:cyclin-dependent kinase 11A [Solea solea]